MSFLAVSMSQAHFEWTTPTKWRITPLNWGFSKSSHFLRNGDSKELLISISIFILLYRIIPLLSALLLEAVDS